MDHEASDEIESYKAQRRDRTQYSTRKGAVPDPTVLDTRCVAILSTVALARHPWPCTQPFCGAFSSRGVPREKGFFVRDSFSLHINFGDSNLKERCGTSGGRDNERTEPKRENRYQGATAIR